MRLPRPEPGLLTGQPFTLAMAQTLGVTRRRLDGPLWRSLGRDLWVATETPDTTALFIAAAQLVLPDRAAVSGLAAASLHGIDLLPQQCDQVDVVLDQSWRPGHRDLIRPHRAPLPNGDVVVINGTRCTSPLRTAYDLARGADLREAVVAVDALLHGRLITLDGLTRFSSERGWPDGARVGRVVQLADAGAASPMESRLRLLLVLDGGLPRPTTQYVVRDRNGLFVGRLDLAYLERQRGVEYDGKIHTEERVLARDLSRHNRLFGAGWPTLRYSADAVLHHKEMIIREVADALRWPAR
jgi:hypothetical protein